jgi:hypothetical protein
MHDSEAVQKGVRNPLDASETLAKLDDVGRSRRFLTPFRTASLNHFVECGSAWELTIIRERLNAEHCRSPFWDNS